MAQIQTVKEVIEELQKHYKPEDTLLITWWQESDFDSFKEPEDAIANAQVQLETCIGHVNDWAWSQGQQKEEVNA